MLMIIVFLLIPFQLSLKRKGEQNKYRKQGSTYHSNHWADNEKKRKWIRIRKWCKIEAISLWSQTFGFHWTESVSLDSEEQHIYILHQWWLFSQEALLRTYQRQFISTYDAKCLHPAFVTHFPIQKAWGGSKQDDKCRPGGPCVLL